MESVLDSDFSDPDLLSKTISKMTSNIKIGLNSKLNAHFLRDHYVHIDNGDSMDIVDIETTDVNAVSPFEEFVIVDGISESSGALLGESIIQVPSSDEIIEEVVEQVPVTTEGLTEAVVEQLPACNVEETVEEEVIEMLPGMGQEIIEDVLDKSSPSMVEEIIEDGVMDDNSTILQNFEESIAAEPPAQFIVDTANAVEDVSLSQIKSGVSVAEPDIVPYFIEEEVVSMPLPTRPAESDLDPSGIVAEDMNSLFEQFENQGVESETTLSIGPDLRRCSNQSFMNGSQNFIHSDGNVIDVISSEALAISTTNSQVKTNYSVVSCPTVVHSAGLGQASSPRYVLLAQTPKGKPKKTTNMVSLLGPNLSSPLLLTKTDHLQAPSQPIEQDYSSHNIVTAHSQNLIKMEPKYLDVANHAGSAAQIDLNMTRTNSELPIERIKDEPVFEEIDITQVPEVKTEVEVGCESTDTFIVSDQRSGRDKSHSFWTKTNSGDIFDKVEKDLLTKPVPFPMSRHSSRPCSPETASRPKQSLDVLNKIPGYMTDLTMGIPLDSTAATLASSALLDGSVCSALLHREPSPDRKGESAVLQYNRLPNYCSDFTASVRHSSTDGIVPNNPKDSDHTRNNRSSRKHSRHRKSRKRSKFNYDSSDVESSDNDLLRVRRSKRGSFSSSSSSFSGSSFSSSDTSTYGHSPPRHRNRSSSPPRRKNHRSKSHKHSPDSRRKEKRSVHKSRRRHKHKRKRRRCRSEDESDTQGSRSPSVENSRAKGHRRHRSPSSSSSVCSMTLEEREQERKKLAHERAMAERRVMYVGGISNKHTPSDLRERFGVFGEIETTAVHFRLRGDNYGFVTYTSPQDAQKAITNGNKVPGPTYTLCYGGRRIFCKTDYADLDGCTAVKEEWALHETKRDQPAEDFDALLQQTLRKLK